MMALQAAAPTALKTPPSDSNNASKGAAESASKRIRQRVCGFRFTVLRFFDFDFAFLHSLHFLTKHFGRHSGP